MAAPTSNSIRVRLYFDYPPPAVVACRMCWLLVDLNKCRVVADLESIIREKFDFSRRNILNLFIEDCYLPHTESIYVVRDNDSIKVKVDSLAQVNGHSSHSDISTDNPRKRPRHVEEDKPAENGESMEWKKKKRKKKSEQTLEKETKPASGDEQRKDSQRKPAEKKKKKGAEQNGPNASHKPAASTKKTSTVRDLPAESNKKPAAPKTKTQTVSSSDSSDSSSEEDEIPQKTLAPKLAPKKPSSTPLPPKAPTKTKLLHPSPSSSDTDSSSDEAPSKTLSQNKPKNTPVVKPITPAATKLGASNSSPASKCQPTPPSLQPTNCTQKQSASAASLPAERVAEQAESSSSEDEIKLVIRRPMQGLLDRGGTANQPPWQGRGRGKAWRGGGGPGPGGRARDAGRGSGRGRFRDFQFSYDGGQQTEQPFCQNDLLTNTSVILQNGVENAPSRDYSSMPLLAAPPQVGQKIAFKLLELTENYTPEVSEYKEGKIVSFDPTTKQVELELLHVSQAPAEPGKFDLVYQNPDGTDRVEYAVSRSSSVTERWDSLLEPRLVI